MPISRAGHALILVLVSISASACLSGNPSSQDRKQPALIRHEFVHQALGTDFRVVVYCKDKREAGRAEDVVVRRLGQIEAVFDPSRESSDIAQVHANAGLGAVRVSNEVYALLRQAQKLADRSGGAFDITAGAYVELWGAAMAAGKLPSQEELSEARRLVGRDKLRLDPINRTAHLTETGMRLDLGGIVPGYACDRAVAALQATGLRHALVDGGSRVAVGEAPPGSDGWLVEVTNARPKAKHRIIRLARQSVASSRPVGDLVQIDGVHYARLVDPRTGLGSRNIGAATVVARRAWQADCLARAAAVLGERQAVPLLRSTPNTKGWFHYPPGLSRRSIDVIEPATQPTDSEPTDEPAPNLFEDAPALRGR